MLKQSLVLTEKTIKWRADLFVSLGLTHLLGVCSRCLDGPSQMFITSHLISEISPRSKRGMTQQTLAPATLMHMDERTHQESSL